MPSGWCRQTWNRNAPAKDIRLETVSCSAPAVIPIIFGPWCWGMGVSGHRAGGPSHFYTTMAMYYVLIVDYEFCPSSIFMMSKLSASAAATPALFYSSSQISSQHHLIAKVWLSHLRCYQSESELVTRFRSNWLENTGQATPDTRQAT